MSHPEPADGERYRARHSDAAPDAYPPSYRYGDGVSAYPLYGEPRHAWVVDDQSPAASPPESDVERIARWRAAAAAAQPPATAEQPPATAEQPSTAAEAPPPRSRAGRDLPVAIGVGLLLGAIVLASLFIWHPAFLGVIVVAVVVATWELVRAIGTSDVHPPLPPLVAGGIATTGLAWFGGPEPLILGLFATVLATLVWRLADGPDGYARDALASVLVAVYVPFLGGFAVMLNHPSDGALRVLVTLAAVVLTDTGGYAAGVFLGRHAMAPSVSPKKSWEGLGGSLLAAGVGGALMLHYGFHVEWWWGALFGIAVSAAAVVGDLAESLIKRDLGVKDMSHLLPGHGGVMDRLDSVLFALPASYAVLTLVAPVTT